MKLGTTILFIFSCLVLDAQVAIYGILADAETKEPIPYANIYIANSEKGVSSDEEGFYRIDDLPFGDIELIVSYVGYEQVVHKIKMSKKRVVEVNLNLKKAAYSTLTVDVTAKKNNKRRKYIKRFTKAFLGYTSNAQDCKIINPEVLLFENKDGILKVKAKDLIIIENQATGYQVLFLLQKFELNKIQAIYAGKPIFIPLESGNSKTLKRWEAQRLTTYNGSLRHFLTSLMDNSLRKEGFEVQLGQLKPDGNFVSRGTVSQKKILQKGSNDFEKYLVAPGFLKVIYNKEESLGNTSNVSFNSDHETMSVSKHQTSFLYLRKAKVGIYENGLAKRPELLLEYGYWSSERVADLLPFEYVPDSESKSSEENIPQLNDFLLTNLIIPQDRIYQGTAYADAIPAITQPDFVQGNEASFLKTDDMVLGLEINGMAKAYPIRILNWHEIVNDVIDNQSIVVTYCPLCGSGMAFESKIDGKLLTFGVSGLLYNSDVLLYDKESQSIWSQLMGKSVAGEYSGQALKYINLQHTSWEDWQSKHPNTLVLSTNTGFIRNYDKTPYEKYVESDKLMFPVSKTSTKLKNKALIAGISVNGKYKAYPFSALAKKEGKIIDEFEGETIEIIYDKSSNSVRILNENIQVVTLYWFAWYAFHPDTKVFQK